jgi:isochorismate synthase
LNKDNKSHRRVSNSLPADLLQLLHKDNSYNSLVFYRLPNQSNVHYLTGEAQKIDSIGDILNQKGFAFTPAANSKSHIPYFITPSTESILEELDTIETPKIDWVTSSKVPIVVSELEYLKQATEMIDAMKAQKLEKVVLSRIKKHVTNNFNPWATFNKLCTKYPSVMVYWVSIPNEGTWIGATPETLLQVDKGVAQTVALAGTQADRGVSLEKVTWGAKEQEEQQIVVDNIQQLVANHFPSAALEMDGPKTVSTGALLHLITRFNWQTEMHNTALESFIKELHPTPAIAGQPRQLALGLINKTEMHDRAFYTGLLGPIDPNSLTHLFVNLRCMQVFDSYVALYLGGGLTANSNPDAEWLETELKAQTLLSVL